MMMVNLFFCFSLQFTDILLITSASGHGKYRVKYQVTIRNLMVCSTSSREETFMYYVMTLTLSIFVVVSRCAVYNIFVYVYMYM